MVNWEIVNDDIMNWAENYKGAPFMALLCDPPYHLHDGKGKGGFMQREWDGAHNISFKPETWSALAQHLLPGAFILAFASSRGWHRLACAMEDSGLIMQPSIFVNGLERDVPLCLGWAQSQGFPKSTRLDKKLDEMAGKLDEREDLGPHPNARETLGHIVICKKDGSGRLTAPATPLARTWQGHRYGGQILRNALEPIIVAQKPWVGKRLDSIVRTGAGAINVDGGRIGFSSDGDGKWHSTPGRGTQGQPPKGTTGIYGHYGADAKPKDNIRYESKGRWPQNLILVHTEFCQREGMRRVKSSNKVSGSCSGPSTAECTQGGYGHRKASEILGHADPDGLETVAAWRCLIACLECGYAWLAVDKEVCPECKAMGEWQCAVRRLGEQSGERGNSARPNLVGKKYGPRPQQACYGKQYSNDRYTHSQHNDSGDCTRYFFNADWSYEIAERLATVDPVFYTPKASRRERDAGLEKMPTDVSHAAYGDFKGTPEHATNMKGKQRNPHPTVKPISLNRYLAGLLLAPSEYAPRRILIPFFGVASEGIGALLAGFEEIVGVEMDAGYCTIGEARMQYWASRPEQLGLF